MRQGFRETLLAGLAASVVIGAAGAAQAGGFALREQSAAGLGQAFAGSAAGAGGLSSMFWNPATITKYEGMNSSWSFTGIIPYAKTQVSPLTSNTVRLLSGGSTLSAGGTGDFAMDALLGTSAANYQFNEMIWLGLSVNAPFGLATKNPTNWAGQVYGRTSKVFSLEATPTIAFKLNDMLSFGVGVRVMHFRVRLTSAAAVTPNAPNVALEGNDTMIGFTAGVTFTPIQGTELGIGYRSQMKPKLEGTLATPLGVTNIASDVTLPDQITIGLRQRITPDLTLLAGFEWTHWKVLNRFPVVITSGPAAGAQATVLDFRYSDGWYASLGAEYRWNPNLTLRAGLGYEKSPVTNAVRSPRLPDSDRVWVTLGGSYQITNKMSLDLSYAHIFTKKAPINIAAGHPAFAGLPFSGRAKGGLDIVSAGINYRWDDPKVVQGNLPVVRKY
ncbi:MAG: outer membrane protein transport protein [Methylobacteriaceae bacterium]|nr:outer membrane protein transport protein [Methylobacteriaceae bacterium]